MSEFWSCASCEHWSDVGTQLQRVCAIKGEFVDGDTSACPYFKRALRTMTVEEAIVYGKIPQKMKL